MAKFTKSFYDWCIENGKEEWLELWDYEKNGCSPKDIGYGSDKKYYFKCPRGLHDSEEKRICNLTNCHTELKCNCCNSFGQWCIENGKEDWLDLWDNEKNNCTPKDVACASNKKYFFKCERGLHDSEQKRINDLTNGNANLICNCCNSFGQWCIDNEKENWLSLWDYEKNNCTPKDISYASHKECWFKCERGLHESGAKRIADLTRLHAEFKCNCCNSFEQWCIDNRKEDWLALWDYELNGCTPKDIAYASNKKYYFKCERGLHASEQKMIVNLTNGNTSFKCNCCNSFGQWCIENGKEDWLDLWDYELNGGCSPKDIGYASGKKYYFKCPRGLHDSELKRISDLTSGNTEFKCNSCNSFEQWCIDNEKEEWLKLWDYELNGGCSPKDIGCATHKKYFFKCDKGLHDSELKIICNLTNGHTEFKCKYCNSFEQWCIDNGKEEWLDLWDYELNDCTPKDIGYGSQKKYFFKCPSGKHKSEQKMIQHLTGGHTELKCNCCNSFGQYLIDSYGENALEKYWDYEKNVKLNPFEISKACSNRKVWIKCQEDETHGSYFVCCNNFTSNNNRCPKCKESHGERKIREYLTKNNIEFIPQKTFPKLLGTGKKPLSYDFYIPSKNLLIEFQGIQHYEPVDFNNEGLEQAEKNFKNQQEHDKRKREYAKQNNIDLLEITYLEEDKIEEILDKIFK